MNAQVYWDGNVGATEYEDRRSIFVTKPVIPQVTFDTLVYSEDDNVAFKTQENKRIELTPEEKTAVNQFANANSTDKIPAEPPLVSTSVATVWTTEVDLIDKDTFDVPWNYVVGDLSDCTDTDSTLWDCPFTRQYDITLNLGFSGLAPNTNIKVDIKDDKDNLIITKQFANVLNSVQVSIDKVLIEEGTKLRVTLTFDKVQTCGIMIPARTYLRIDQSGSKMAQRMADYFFNTIGNMVFYSGIEARFQKDDADKPAIIMDDWAITD